jgi:hypothetical protein
MITDCVCDAGYHDSDITGQCEGWCLNCAFNSLKIIHSSPDIDECAVNNGGCEQVCENELGRYRCRCSVQGYQISEDGHTCIGNRYMHLIQRMPTRFVTSAEKQCHNLTQADAPANGGLSCYWHVQENSQFCQVKCDDGFEHPERINLYERCGPETGFIWTFQQDRNDSILEPCIGTSYYSNDAVSSS